MFFGVIAIDGALNRGEMSNVASAYRPGVPPTTIPPSGESFALKTSSFLILTLILHGLLDRILPSSTVSGMVFGFVCECRSL